MPPENKRISRRQFFKRSALAAAVLAAVPEVIPAVVASARPDRINDPAPAWYVDSVHGNDGSDGKSPQTAFATITKLLSESILVGQTVGLAAGSHWREMLRLDVPEITVMAYGDGPRPILDASDVIPTTAWTKTPARQNLFQATVSPHMDEPIIWVNVWESGKFLPRVADGFQCEATPGSCFITTNGVTSVTIYVHPTDSSKSLDNKVYEFSSRLYGIDLYNSDYCTIQDIQTQKNLHNNGSTALGRWGTAVNCTFLDGSKHNVYGRTGVKFVNCMAKNQFYNDYSTLFVYNDPYPQSEGITFIGCTAINDTYSDKSTGFLGHSVIGVFGDVRYANCTVINCGTGFVDNAASKVSFDNCRVENAAVAWGLYLSERPYIMNQCTAKNCQSAIVVWTDGVQLTVNGLQVCANNTQPTGAVVIIPKNQCNLSFAKCIFDTKRGSIFWATGNGPLLLNVNNSQFINAALSYNLPSPQLTLVSDSNCFQRSAAFLINENSFHTLSAFQESGQDTHSTSGNCAGCP